jgi:hypothetical protein
MCKGEGIGQARRKIGMGGWEEQSERTIYTLVLNSISAVMANFSHLAVQVSPSSMTILPNRIPRAYMFGIEITYAGGHTENEPEIDH